MDHIVNPSMHNYVIIAFDYLHSAVFPLLSVTLGSTREDRLHTVAFDIVAYIF